ncbi:hypothetical protein [Neobacillus drentensis]|uniref:hypothetical protein n=1 Tax=Neobacillus drentensis TaxID=220684 RepID=UPI000826351A|nr:hypothetical protein [Neobacillus drentensis]
MISRVKEFKDKELEYEEWCEKHQNGYVFNRAGGKTGNVLHTVGCWHLNVPSRKGTYTTRYPKYCSENLADLLSVVDGLSKPNSWRECSICFNK